MQSTLDSFFKTKQNTTAQHSSDQQDVSQMEDPIHLSDRSFIYLGQLPASVVPDMEKLLALRPDEPDTVVIAGREIATPRFVAHYLRSYQYTGRLHPAGSLPDLLEPLLAYANSTLMPCPDDPTKKYNQVLVNFYMHGGHYIGKHSDDERQLVPNSTVFSASFGQERIFRIRMKKGGTVVKDIPMLHGSYIVMCGDMQKGYTHEVPKVTGKRGDSLGPRVNVTFRVFS